MARIRKVTPLERIGYVVQAAGFIVATSLLRLIPLSIGSAIFGWLGRTVGPALPMTRKARRNLEIIMPELDRAQRRAVIRGMWDNLGRYLAEVTHLERLWDPTLLDEAARDYVMAEIIDAAADGTPITVEGERLTIEGLENFVRMLLHPGPAIVFTAHMGNWELLPAAAAKVGAYMSVVFRTPNNPYVARRIERMRRGLVKLLPKGVEGAIAAAAVMNQGGRLGLLVDQKQNRGVAVPFMGQPAMTGPTLAKLALKYDAPVFGAYVRRAGPRRMRVIVTPPLEAARTGDDAADEMALLTAMNATIEEWIRAHPEQWLWLHRRWPKEIVPQ